MFLFCALGGSLFITLFKFSFFSVTDLFTFYEFTYSNWHSIACCMYICSIDIFTVVYTTKFWIFYYLDFGYIFKTFLHHFDNVNQEHIMEEFSSLLFSRPSGCWFVFLCVCVVLMCSLSRPHMWGICSDVLRSWNVSSASVQWRRRHKRWALPQTPGSLHSL